MLPEFQGLVLFSSHSWRHHEHRTRLHGLIGAKWEKNRDFIDLSVPTAHPIRGTRTARELGIQLRNRISKCDAFLVFTGMYADSDWINFEVDVAFALAKPIIPIAPWGQERHSGVATDFASCDVVRWNSDSICNAILSNVMVSRRIDFELMLERRKVAYEQELAARKRAQRARLLYGGSTESLATLALMGIYKPDPLSSAGKRRY